MISYSVIKHLLFRGDMIKSENFGFFYSPIGLSRRLMAQMWPEIIQLRRIASLLYRAWKEDYTPLTLAVSLSHIHLTLTFAFNVCIEYLPRSLCYLFLPPWPPRDLFQGSLLFSFLFLLYSTSFFFFSIRFHLHIHLLYNFNIMSF